MPLRLSLPVLLLLTACSEGSSFVRPPDYTVSDSAGITVVQNHPVSARFLGVWSVDSRPSVTFAGSNGAAAGGAADIRNLVLLPNEMIAALTGVGQAANRIEFFDSNGKHIATHGQTTDSATSFRSITSAYPAGGDTVMLIDAGARRMIWVSAANGVVRSHELDERMIKRIVGPDAAGLTGSVFPVTAAVYAARVRRGSSDPENLRQGSVTFHLIDVDRGLERKLPSYVESGPKEFAFSTGPAYMNTVVQPVRGNFVVTRAPNMRSSADSSAVMTTGSRVCVAVSNRAEIECVDADDHRTVIKWPVDTITYSDSDRRNFEQSLMGSLQKAAELTPADKEKLMAAQEFPVHLPFVNVLAVDADGNFWLNENAVTSSGQRYSRFRVFDPSGKHIAFADGFELTGFGSTGGLSATTVIGRDAVFRKVVDSTGVSRIGRFAIRKRR